MTRWSTTLLGHTVWGPLFPCPSSLRQKMVRSSSEDLVVPPVTKSLSSPVPYQGETPFRSLSNRVVFRKEGRGERTVDPYPTPLQNERGKLKGRVLIFDDPTFLSSRFTPSLSSLPVLRHSGLLGG